MEKQQFKTSINASRERVWEILWGDTSYRAWTSVFSEGSHVVTDWKKGSKTLFLDGKGSGMVSVIAEHIPNEFMAFKHLGDIKNGIEDTESEEVKAWSGAMENYTLKTVNGQTELEVTVDIDDKFKDYFIDAFPKALAKVKTLSEQE